MYIGLNTHQEQEQIVRALKGPHWDRKRHGSLYDRGGADSYYGRGPSPHYGGVGGSEFVNRVEQLTPEERDEYMAGYRDNEQSGDKKSWD
jgi:hypothetical protein